MSGLSWPLVLTILGAAMMAAALSVLYLQQTNRRSREAPVFLDPPQIVFLFEGEALVDQSPAARAWLGEANSDGGSWESLIEKLQCRFRNLERHLSTLSADNRTYASEAEDGTYLEAQWRGGLTRIVLYQPDETGASETTDPQSSAALQEELATLRSVLDKAPVLMWREDSSRNVIWANTAYWDVARARLGASEEMGWPLPNVFDDPASGTANDPAETRVQLAVGPDDASVWFELSSVETDDGTLRFAHSVDRLVETEETLREFIQTLSKTFAHLPTGLAVFDKDRRLALFNPALTDLSSLQPSFLGSRPTLVEFLDALRERQRMPEPKDYKSWRQSISALEKAAASGTHTETWSLPTGQTYRVTGRPHPNGAVAFLFEDISAEISLTRRFRSDLELSQSVLDSLPEAIAVFSHAGELIQSNRAYDRLWNSETSSSFIGSGVYEGLKIWEARSTSAKVWARLRSYLDEGPERQAWSERVVLNDGQELTVRLEPLVGKATFIGFTPITEPPTVDAEQQDSNEDADLV